MADRLADGTGITIDLAVVPMPCDQGNSVEHGHAVTAAGRAIGNSFGSGVRDIYTKPEGFKRHRKDIQAALDTRYDQTVEIQMSFELR